MRTMPNKALKGTFTDKNPDSIENNNKTLIRKYKECNKLGVCRT